MLKIREFSILIAACWLLPIATGAQGSSDEQELSLQQDRAHLDQLREEIPEEVKRENDDLAFILKLFDDKKRQPTKIRQEFNKVYNRVRKNKQKEFKRERDQYTKDEKKKRKAFIREAKKKRKKFLQGDPSKESKKEFFDDERTARKEYFAQEKEKRRDFEADMRAKRREFDDYMKDQRKTFDDRFQQFKKEQKAMKEQERKAELLRSHPTSMAVQEELSPQNKAYLEDFKKIPKKGGAQLSPTEEK